MGMRRVPISVLSISDVSSVLSLPFHSVTCFPFLGHDDDMEWDRRKLERNKGVF
jgi:hypothetical protein